MPALHVGVALLNRMGQGFGKSYFFFTNSTSI